MLPCLVKDRAMRRFHHAAQGGNYVVARSMQAGCLFGRFLGQGLDDQAACDVASGVASHSIRDGPQLRAVIDEKGILV